MRDILDHTFAPHRSPQAASRISLEGQDTLLSSRDALSVTLALHELVTNAVKHGAFANSEGRIQLRWTVEPSPAVATAAPFVERGGWSSGEGAGAQGIRVAPPQLARSAIGCGLFV